MMIMLIVVCMVNMLVVECMNDNSAGCSVHE